MNRFVVGRGWVGRTALLAGALIGFAALAGHPSPARAGGGDLISIRDSTGPIGITRGQTGRVAIMLPAVQRGSDIALHG